MPLNKTRSHNNCIKLWFSCLCLHFNPNHIDHKYLENQKFYKNKYNVHMYNVYAYMQPSKRGQNLSQMCKTTIQHITHCKVKKIKHQNHYIRSLSRAYTQHTAHSTPRTPHRRLKMLPLSISLKIFIVIYFCH